MKPASRTTQHTPRGSDSPPPHALGYAARVLGVIYGFGYEPLFRDARGRYAHAFFATVRQGRRYTDTTQAELTRRARCSPSTGKRTEATFRALGVITVPRWWQDAQHRPVKPDPHRRGRTPPDRHRRRAVVTKRLHFLAVQQSLGTQQRRMIRTALGLDILAHRAHFLATNPGPLTTLLTGTTDPPPPLSATGLSRATWKRAPSGNPLPINATAADPNQDRARRGESRKPPAAKGSRETPGTSPFGREKNRRPKSVEEGPSAEAPGPRTPMPPAPADPQHGARAPASSPPPSGRPLRALGLDPGTAPAPEPSARSGRGEKLSARTDRAPDGNRTWTLADLDARTVLLHRFESDDHAALRATLHGLHDLRLTGPLPEALPPLILRAITETLRCTEDDADFLARRYFERLRDSRRRAPHGPPPVPRVIHTDATGQPWVLEYEQPDPVRR